MQKKSLKRLFIIGIIGVIYSLYLFIDNIITKTSIYELIIASIIIIFSIMFLIFQKKLSKKIK